MEFSSTFANTILTGLGDLHDAGSIRYYDVTDVLLAELYFGDPAFGTASGGQTIANSITSESSAVGGVADYVNVIGADTSSVLYNCTVSDLTGSGDIKMSTVTVGTGDMVRFATGAYKWTLPII
jgi:hypothetical protein